MQKFKWDELFKLPAEDMEPKLTISEPEEFEKYVKLDVLRKQLKIKPDEIQNMAITKF